MIFRDNVIKENLKNVYFITGTPCGGKTTISRALAEKYDLIVYDVDEQFPKHQKISNSTEQPAMNRTFKDADEFFGRTLEEYSQWLLDNTREQLDFVLMDLIRISQNQKVICDLHLTIDEAAILTDFERIVFLIREPSNLIDEYCNRKDHNGFKLYIHSASNVEKAKANCNAVLELLNKKIYKQIKESNYFWLERNSDSTVEATVAKVAGHFGLE